MGPVSCFPVLFDTFPPCRLTGEHIPAQKPEILDINIRPLDNRKCVFKCKTSLCFPCIVEIYKVANAIDRIPLQDFRKKDILHQTHSKMFALLAQHRHVYFCSQLDYRTSDSHTDTRLVIYQGLYLRTHMRNSINLPRGLHQIMYHTPWHAPGKSTQQN